MNTFIIAEAGVNHNGKIETAFEMIDIALYVEANAIKFQTYITEELVSESSVLAEYQKLSGFKNQFEMLKKYELTFEDFEKIKKYCDSKGIMFMSSPFDLKSACFLNKLGLKIFKIASGEITNYPLLKQIAKYGKKVILSTGMCNLIDIEKAINILTKFGLEREKIALMHCNTEYPTKFEDVNLRAIQTLKEKFNLEVGFSDHTTGIEASIAAVALGASIIEKHLTLDRNMEGPDHKASLEPNEFKRLVQAIRNVEKSLGDGIKKPSTSEIKNIEIVRKTIVAKKEINPGEEFSEDNITTKRTGKIVLDPMEWENILGKKAKRKFNKDEPIEV
ncbi:MAG: N-acetylneuraminate synthase [Candidatus Calescibacterium sp.]|nr:N-acetylneuraminate synthase [Candidatus Calescibacterium sp.]MDW8132993.1 N-acetylneuraminate synthase [Candidatus Calescibacterium sp.]